MKTNEKSLKIKVFSGLSATLAATPLVSIVSCGKQNEVDNRVGSEYDKEYGINEAVYKKLKIDFINQVIASLVDPSPEEILEIHKDLNTVFTKFDAQYNEQNLSYTALTNSIIEFASRVYNVRLQRQTVTKTAKWSDIEVEFQGMQKSFLEYMRKEGISRELQNKMLVDSAEQFNGNPGKHIKNFIAGIKEKYDDPLMGLIVAKSKLLTCFASVNEEIALVGASIRLNEFFDNHEITYDVNTSDDATNKFDNIKKANLLIKDSDFSNHILDVFSIKDKQTQQTLTKFDPFKVCPGFVVKPILKSWYENPLTNTYTLKIDWTCVSEIYYQTHDQEKIENTTAHFFNKSNDKYGVDNIDEFNVREYFKDIRESAGLNYDVILSSEGERTAIKETYLNSVEKHLTFDWFESDKDINAFDAFFYGKRLDEGTTTTREYLVNFSSLAMSGLSIAATNDKANKDNFIRVDKILSADNTEEDEKENDYDDLIRNFIDNCTMSAISDADATKPENEVTSTLFVKYKNSTYDFDKTKEAKAADSVTKKCFTISQKAYDFLTTAYNEQMDFVEMYTDEQIHDEYEDVKDDVILQSVFFGINVLFTAYLSFVCIVPIFAGHMPIYVVLLILTWISMGEQCALLGILVDKKLKPLKKLASNAKKLLHRQEVLNFNETIKKLGSNYSLCRYDDDHNIFQDDYDAGFAVFTQKEDFVSEILPTIEALQNINQLQEFDDFMNAINTSGASPDDYQKAMKVWGKNGWCQSATMGLIFTSLAVDIASIVLMSYCPECTNWTLMKQARVMAGYEGGYKSVIQTYKNLEKAKQLLDYAKKIGYTSKYTLQDLAKLTPNELEKFVVWLGPDGKLATPVLSTGIKELVCPDVWKNIMDAYVPAETFKAQDVRDAVIKGLENIFEGIKNGKFGFKKVVQEITSNLARTPGKIIPSASGSTAHFLDTYLEILDRTFKGLPPLEKFSEGSAFAEFQELVLNKLMVKFPMVKQSIREVQSSIALAKASLRANPKNLESVWTAFDKLDDLYKNLIGSEAIAEELCSVFAVNAMQNLLMSPASILTSFFENAKVLLKGCGRWKLIKKI